MVLDVTSPIGTFARCKRTSWRQKLGILRSWSRKRRKTKSKLQSWCAYFFSTRIWNDRSYVCHFRGKNRKKQIVPSLDGPNSRWWRKTNKYYDWRCRRTNQVNSGKWRLRFLPVQKDHSQFGTKILPLYLQRRVFMSRQMLIRVRIRWELGLFYKCEYVLRWWCWDW